jgi:predicted PurR-regulated permease PerM
MVMTDERPSNTRNPDSKDSFEHAHPGLSLSHEIDVEAGTERKRTVVNVVVLGILLVMVTSVIIPMLKIFLTPLVLACTFVSLFFPLYKDFYKFFRGNRAFSALACCVTLVVGFVVPIYFIGYLVTHQLLNLYQSIEPVIQAFVRGENTGILSRLKDNPVFEWLTRFDINWQNALVGSLKTAGAAIGKMVNKTSLGALEIVIGLFMTLFIMFYLFMDGERIIQKIRNLLPLRKNYQDMIMTRFILVSRATVKGTLIIASVQGTLGAIILLIAGVKTWLLWGVVMIALGLIPMLGAWIVLVTAAVIQLISGNIWQGIFILALSFGVVSTIDNILRPRLVGQNARMHDLLIFFSTIGGLAMFGPVGIITGPVMMAFFVSIIEICVIELEQHIGMKVSD